MSAIRNEDSAKGTNEERVTNLERRVEVLEREVAELKALLRAHLSAERDNDSIQRSRPLPSVEMMTDVPVSAGEAPSEDEQKGGEEVSEVSFNHVYWISSNEIIRLVSRVRRITSSSGAYSRRE